jgi:acetolactate synthase-1/3 small subunit
MTMSEKEASEPRQNVTIVADVDDKLITLNRVVSLLRSRRFSTVSVGTAKTQTPGVVRLTVVVDSKQTPPRRVVACLSKLVDVWNVTERSPDASLSRELALVKVAVPPGVAGLPPDLAQDAIRVLHRDDRAMVLEVVAEPTEVDRILRSLELKSFEIVELARASQLTMDSGLPTPSGVDENLARTGPTS